MKLSDWISPNLNNLPEDTDERFKEEFHRVYHYFDARTSNNAHWILLFPMFFIFLWPIFIGVSYREYCNGREKSEREFEFEKPMRIAKAREIVHRMGILLNIYIDELKRSPNPSKAFEIAKAVIDYWKEGILFYKDQDPVRYDYNVDNFINHLVDLKENAKKQLDTL